MKGVRRVSVIFEIRFARSAGAVFGFLSKGFPEIAQIGCHKASGERGHSGRFCRRRECRCILPDELLHAQRLLAR
jgi:hypothetical protein